MDDAEDAEIILHEYGHAIQDDQVPGWGESRGSAARWARGSATTSPPASSRTSKPQNLRPAIGSWDAIEYSDDDPPCLRRVDSNKKYPRDIADEVHDDGEIWSACLWELRRKLGRRASDRVTLAHHFLLKKDATFEDGAKAMLLADENLNDGKNKTDIRDVFVRRGILPKPKKRKKTK